MMATNRLPPNNRRYKTSVPFDSLFQRRYFSGGLHCRFTFHQRVTRVLTSGLVIRIRQASGLLRL